MSDDPKPGGKGPDASEDEARRTILARRRRFVAVALASAGVAAGSSSCDKNPLVCLSPVPVEDTAPTVCLSVPMDPDPPDAGTGGEDGGADDGGADDGGAGDAGAGDAGDAGVAEDADAGDGGKPPPRVCLRVAPPPKPTAPQPCLKFAPPVDKKKI